MLGYTANSNDPDQEDQEVECAHGEIEGKQHEQFAREVAVRVDHFHIQGHFWFYPVASRVQEGVNVRRLDVEGVGVIVLVDWVVV